MFEKLEDFFGVFLEMMSYFLFQNKKAKQFCSETD